MSSSKRFSTSSAASVDSALSSPPPTGVSALRTRLWTAAVALPVLLAIVFLAPDRIFTGFIGLVTAWALYEVFAMAQQHDASRWLTVIAVGGLAAVFLFYRGEGSLVLAIAAISSTVVLTLLVGILGADRMRIPFLVSSVGALYVGALFPYFAFLRNRPHGFESLVLMLLLVIAGDTGAYLVGSRIGRIRLLPRVSPGKTVEGVIGSIVASIFAALALRLVLPLGLGLKDTITMAALLNLAAQAGDLAESALKRVAGVKDSGWLFPGHGGLLDRADSLVFAAVFSYYYFR